MAWYETSLLILSFILLIPIAVVFIRHFPQISAIETKHIPEEKQQQVKVIMAEQRLYRKLKRWFESLAKIFQPLFSLLKTLFSSWQEKLKELEKKYKIEALTIKAVTDKGKESLQNKINILLKQAWELADSENYDKAESIFIQIIELEPKSIEAFEGLGKIYYEEKKFDEAREVYNYILKILRDQTVEAVQIGKFAPEAGREDKQKTTNSLKANIYFQLAEVYLAAGNLDKSQIEYERALDLEKNNPKYLDALIDICIMKKDKIKAQDLLIKLKSVNPDNKKLSELEEKISAI